MSRFRLAAHSSGVTDGVVNGAQAPCPMTGPLDFTGAVADCQWEARASYTLRDFEVYVKTFSGATGSAHAVFNGSNVITVSISATGIKTDTTTTQSVVAGDLISADLDQASGMHGDEIRVQRYGVSLDGTIPPYGVANASISSATSGLRYMSPCYVRSGISAEAEAEYTLKDSQTFSDMRTYLSTWGETRADLVLRKNRADTSLLITPSATGEFLDTTNTASYVAGDEIDFKIGQPIITNSVFEVFQLEGSADFNVFGGGRASQAAGEAWIAWGEGAAIGTDNIEQTNIPAFDSATVKNLQANVAAYAQDRKIQTLRNGSAGAQSFTFTATGVWEDTTNTDAVVNGDDIGAEQASSPATAGNNSFWVFMQWTYAVAAAVRLPTMLRPMAHPVSIGHQRGL